LGPRYDRIEDEQFEQRAIAVATIDSLRFAHIEWPPHWRIIEKSMRGRPDQQRNTLFGVAHVGRSLTPRVA